MVFKGKIREIQWVKEEKGFYGLNLTEKGMPLI